ncbi:hypothetical protein [Marinifilum flexuosum]|uniref:Uncharacterized protein n=1 Tax=Marinifilum flexuosum TaxID=1117708 RepID=A0A419WN19_9BACT|nr:hypothetical protein [Marinifilum flexuosum]RKD96873.1 hypothetical protein BXY64_3822 [Marinifilum flexuosum]
MKKEKILNKLEQYFTNKNYVRLTRKKGSFEGISTGFILGKSNNFILIQETDEFRILGYQIFPIETIKHVRYNKNDKTYERILKEEGLLANVGLKYKIDLTDWKSICRDVKKTGLTVISECEHPKIKSFCIGNLKRVNKKSISIRYFNAQGIYDKENTTNDFKNITKLSFDDHYANVFSKYAK